MSIATCLASFVGTMCMAFFANLPFALSAGLGLNAYSAYTVCGEMGYSWQIALFAVSVEGLIFIVLSLTNVREAISDAIPLNLKKSWLQLVLVCLLHLLDYRIQDLYRILIQHL